MLIIDFKCSVYLEIFALVLLLTEKLDKLCYYACGFFSFFSCFMALWLHTQWFRTVLFSPDLFSLWHLSFSLIMLLDLKSNFYDINITTSLLLANVLCYIYLHLFIFNLRVFISLKQHRIRFVCLFCFFIEVYLTYNVIFCACFLFRLIPGFWSIWTT